MKKIRNIRIIFIILSAVVICIVSSMISYSLIKKDDLTIRESYEVKKSDYELLKSAASNSIREGEGLHIEKIGNNIEYTISSEEDKIEFSYNIKDYKDEYNAKIVLSNDYEIISQEYSVDMISSFEEYKKQYLRSKAVQSFINGLVITFIFLSFCIEFFKSRKNY